jgi:hypothetical protein
MSSSRLLSLGCALALGLSVAHALPQTFTGNNGSQGAAATFDIVGGTLTVTLSATTGDVLDPSGILTTVFFNLDGTPLTPLSAAIAAGSAGVNGAPSSGSVGGEWSYATGFSQYGANSGISSTGLGIFSNSGNFGGPDLDGAGNGSVSYGLLTGADDFTTGNSQVTAGGRPFFKNSLVFTLNGVTATTVSNVTFQWGTSLTEPSAPGIPNGGPGVPDEGSTLVLTGIGLCLVTFTARRVGSRKQ